MFNGQKDQDVAEEGHNNPENHEGAQDDLEDARVGQLGQRDGGGRGQVPGQVHHDHLTVSTQPHLLLLLQLPKKTQSETLKYYTLLYTSREDRKP